MNESQNPWQIIDQQEVYKNNWISVTHFNVINPSGGRGVYGKVHFQNLAIGVIPMDEEGNVYLVGQYRFPINAYSWEIPEGGGYMDVEPVLSAQRELIEETGLVAANWKMILDMHLSNSVSDERALLFLATGLTQETAAPEETEQLLIKKLPFPEVYEMVCNGKITDSMTVAGILRVRLMQLEGAL